MTDDPRTDDPRDGNRIETRAEHLLPEEERVGSDDPHAQAEAILTDSDIREADQNAAPDSFLEHRTSAQTVNPLDQSGTPLEPPD